MSSEIIEMIISEILPGTLYEILSKNPSGMSQGISAVLPPETPTRITPETLVWFLSVIIAAISPEIFAKCYTEITSGFATRIPLGISQKIFQKFL